VLRERTLFKPIPLLYSDRLLERIAAQVSDSHDLGYTDSPFYNDHAGSGFFPEYVETESTSPDSEKKE
jgi:hypothetical protein